MEVSYTDIANVEADYQNCIVEQEGKKLTIVEDFNTLPEDCKVTLKLPYGTELKMNDCPTSEVH